MTQIKFISQLYGKILSQRNRINYIDKKEVISNFFLMNILIIYLITCTYKNKSRCNYITVIYKTETT